MKIGLLQFETIQDSNQHAQMWRLAEIVKPLISQLFFRVWYLFYKSAYNKGADQTQPISPHIKIIYDMKLAVIRSTYKVF